MGIGKYNISEDGIIYSLNDDGSISQIGKIIDGKISVIEDDMGSKPYNISMRNEYYLNKGNDILNSMDDILGEDSIKTDNNETSEYDTASIAKLLAKEEQIRVASKINGLKSLSIDRAYFDKIMLTLIDGFVWGKTSSKNINSSYYKDSTYYYYLDSSKKIYLYQNKNYKVFHTLSVTDLKFLPERLKSQLYFDEMYSLNQWLFLIDSFGLSVKFNSRELQRKMQRECNSIFGGFPVSFIRGGLELLEFESNLFSVTLFLKDNTNDDSPQIVSSINITYKAAPEKSFIGNLF